MSNDLSARGRIGGLTRAARAPSASAMTSAPRAAALAKIYADAGISVPAPDADPVELAEMERRKKAARAAHMARLNRLAANARRTAALARGTVLRAMAEAEILASDEPV
jgi:hypothetical protein